MSWISDLNRGLPVYRTGTLTAELIQHRRDGRGSENPIAHLIAGTHLYSRRRNRTSDVWDMSPLSNQLLRPALLGYYNICILRGARW